MLMPDQRKYSYDPIPEKAISLSEAFERVLKAVKAKPEVLVALHSELKEYLVKNRKAEERRDKWKSVSPQSLIALHHCKEAVVFFRSTLARGELTTYIRDPEDGTVLQLLATDWSPVGGRLLLLEPPYAFEDDFLVDAPFSGNPKTFIRGAYRPVFLWRREFQDWVNKTFAHEASPRGRRPGSGSWQAADRSLYDKMKRLIDTYDAKSANDAARQVAKEAPGAGTIESKQTRLAKGYRKYIGSERN